MECFKYYPDGAAVREGNFVGNVIQPTPDYVKFAEAYGGSGQRVQKADLLRPALRRALEAVASGQTFLLDVITNPERLALRRFRSSPRGSKDSIAAGVLPA